MIGLGGPFAAPGAAAGWLARATAWALDSLAFPPACPICEGEAEGSAFCPPCRLELLEAPGRACPRCAMPIGLFADVKGGCSECRGRPLGFDAAVALGPYQGPIRSLCLRLKHARDGWIARWLAEVLAEGQADRLLAEPDPLIVPVPLHWRRRLHRGYNQAEALAQGLGKALGLEVRSPLRRVVATPKLARSGRTERARLIRGAFQARRGADVRGRTVFLVDDILTTGATSGAAARVLKQAGASRVVAVVVARAEGKP